jgi:hypothetical protein
VLRRIISKDIFNGFALFLTGNTAEHTSFDPSSVRLGHRTVYSARREADFVMPSVIWKYGSFDYDCELNRRYDTL